MMAQSAGRVKPGNNGQTDVGRGEIGAPSIPMEPNGRVLSVTGDIGMKANSNRPDALIRRVKGRGEVLAG
jgi:hypothetical protein